MYPRVVDHRERHHRQAARRSPRPSTCSGQPRACCFRHAVDFLSLRGSYHWLPPRARLPTKHRATVGDRDVVAKSPRFIANPRNKVMVSPQGPSPTWPRFLASGPGHPKEDTAMSFRRPASAKKPRIHHCRRYSDAACWRKVFWGEKKPFARSVGPPRCCGTSETTPVIIRAAVNA